MDENRLRKQLAGLSPQQRAALRDRIGPTRAPLTPTQFGIWLFDQLNPGTTAYHNPAALRIRGPLDAEAVWGALDAIQRRHDALRIRLGEDAAGLPVQMVCDQPAVDRKTTDLRDAPEAQRDQRALAAAVACVREPFDLEHGPVWRARLIRLTDHDHVLVVSFHHLISDGWSLGTVLADFVAAYSALAAGRPAGLVPPPRRYLDVVSTIDRLDAADRARLTAYWRRELDGAPTAIALPADRGTVHGTEHGTAGYAGGSTALHLDRDTTAALRAAGRPVGASLFGGVLAVFLAYLHRVSGQRDLVITTPVARRDEPGLAEVVGCLLNTVPVRVRIEPDDTFRVLLARTAQALVSAVEHAGLPFGDIVTATGASSTGEAAISNVMVLHGNAPMSDVIAAGLEFSRYHIPLIAAKHDWALLLTPRATQVSGELEYRSELFTAATAARVCREVEALARSLATRPDQSIMDG